MMRTYYPLTQKVSQSGQAMVEYAILLTLMVTLIAGGIELGLAAFNSNRTAEGAKSGVTYWLQNGVSCALEDTATSSKYIDRGCLFDSTAAPVAGVGTLTSGSYAIPATDNWGIGDHSSSGEHAVSPGFGYFGNPVCDSAGAHETGLPTDALPLNQTDLRTEAVTPTGVTAPQPAKSKFYLYNPLPLDISGCANASGANYSDFVENFLPVVNRAILSLYVKECVNTSGQIIDCADAVTATGGGTDKVYLRLPGGAHIGAINPSATAPISPPKTSLSAPTSPMTRVGIFTDIDPVTSVELSEYVLNTSVGQVDTLTLTNTGLLDMFRMHCREPGGDFPDVTEEDNCAATCYADALADYDGDGVIVGDGYDDGGYAKACDVRVTLRYRHTFESLVIMAGWSKPLSAAARVYADNPFTDDTGTSLDRGILGTELTRGFILKPQKLFRGCYESVTSVSTTSKFIDSRACN